MRHDLIPNAKNLDRPLNTARELGYRMPAEWEPQETVWLTAPHNEGTWPGCMDEALAQFAKLVDALSKVVKVRTTQSLNIKTDDSWIRDYGPIFVLDKDGSLACHDFIFNCWGDKYRPWDSDNLTPQYIARDLDVPIWIHDFVLEGGSIEVNGKGTVMTTEQCLLHPNRNAQLSREQIEQVLHRALGTSHVIWLPGGIEGDDTDGHIDDVARFINPTTILAIRAPEGHPDFIPLERNRIALEKAKDQDGNALSVIPLPVPEPIEYNFPADEYGLGGKRMIPASHANFLITNQHAFVPVFGQPSDDIALKTIEDAMPGNTIIPVRCETLVVGLGAIHCMSQQQPASSPIPP